MKASEKIENKKEFLFKIILFIVGFAAIFIILSIITSLLFYSMHNIRFYINIIFGVIIIIFAFNFLGVINILFLNMEKKFNFKSLPAGYISAFLIGMSFAAGWSPCVGPFLGGILGLVSSNESMIKGIILLIVYSLGLGIPLILMALFFNYLNPVVIFLKKHSNIIKIISGFFLLIIGILILFGALNQINSYSIKFASYLKKAMPLSDYIFSFILFLIAFLFLLRIILKKKMLIGSLIFIFLFILLGILNLLKIFSLLEMFISYLTYQGL